MNPISFEVIGHPKGQPRARATVRKGAKFASVYSDGSADDWKALVAIEARNHLPISPLAMPIRVDIVFRFPRVNSHFGTGKKSNVLKDNAPIWHTKKPDRDNCEKAVLDVLTQLGMWQDDCQVCCGEVSKQYVSNGQRPGMWICISDA